MVGLPVAGDAAVVAGPSDVAKVEAQRHVGGAMQAWLAKQGGLTPVHSGATQRPLTARAPVAQQASTKDVDAEQPLTRHPPVPARPAPLP